MSFHSFSASFTKVALFAIRWIAYPSFEQLALRTKGSAWWRHGGRGGLGVMAHPKIQCAQPKNDGVFPDFMSNLSCLNKDYIKLSVSV